MITIPQTIREIVAAARAEGADPVEWLLDYFREKNSYPTRREVERLIAESEIP